MTLSHSHDYKTATLLVALLACWLCAGAQTRTVQLQSGKLVYAITNLGQSFNVVDVATDVDLETLMDCTHILTSDIKGDTLKAGTEIHVDVTYYPNNDGDGSCSQLKLVSNNCVTCVDGSQRLNHEMQFKGTVEEFFNKTAEDWNYDYTTRKSPHHVSRTFRVNHDITSEEALFYISVTYYVRNNITVPYDCAGGYDTQFAYAETVTARCVGSKPGEEDAVVNDTTGVNDTSVLDGLDSIKQYVDTDLFDTIAQILGLDQHATPEEALVIGTLAAILAILFGGAGGALGGAGGALPPPIEGAPSGPPPIENPYQDVEDKYVTHYPDGSITVKDPITGEMRHYQPDGQGGYDNPLGGGFKSKEDMLNHLAYLDRNSATLSQDAATAAINKAQQHEQWEAKNARDRERGCSDEMADYRDWKDNEEKKQEQITKLARKYGVTADEESVKRAIKLDQIKAGIESAKQEAVAADQNVTVVGLESTKNVATTALALIPLALSGAGTVSAATMANAKIVQSCYTMGASITGKVGDAYVKGEDMGKAVVHGTVTGAIDVAKNYAGDIAGKAAGAVGGASKAVKTIVNLGTEAAVVVGGEGVKKGYEEYAESGDLNKALDKALDAVKDEGKKHIINKVAEVGIDKLRGLASGKTSVEGTRKHADATGKTVTSRQQAVTRTQQQVTSAKESVAVTRKNVEHSQQQLTAARGKLNTANEQLSTANKQMATAQQKLGQAKTPAQASQAQAELTRAQQGVAQAQQNVNQASRELQTAQRIDTATKRVAQHAENNLQKTQFGAQKAQSDLQAATAQHDQALRDALAAEQRAQIDKTVAHATGNDIVGGARAVEEHLKNEGYLPKDNK